jgi:hypothetical protein
MILWFVGVALILIITVCVLEPLFKDSDAGFWITLRRLGGWLLFNLLPLMMVVGPSVLWWERRSAILINWILMMVYLVLMSVCMYYSGYSNFYVYLTLFFLPYWIMVFLIGHKRWVSIL